MARDFCLVFNYGNAVITVGSRQLGDEPTIQVTVDCGNSCRVATVTVRELIDAVKVGDSVVIVPEEILPADDGWRNN